MKNIGGFMNVINVKSEIGPLKKVLLQGSFYGIFSVFVLVIAKLLKYNFTDIMNRKGVG